MKKICAVVMVAVIIFVIWANPIAATVTPTISEDYIPSEITEIELPKEEVSYTKEELIVLIVENTQKKADIQEKIFELEKLDLSFVPALEVCKKELELVESTLLFYQEKYDIIIAEEWIIKTQEYPVASQIYRYLKDFGYNDAVAAGIIGNLMAEVGGQTFQIRWWAKSEEYYGICQWNKAYIKVWNTSLEEQLNFLTSSIRYEMNTYGYKYQSGFNYEQFCRLTNEQEAAAAFAKCYERCSSKSIPQRKKNATVAMNYFGGY